MPLPTLLHNVFIRVTVLLTCVVSVLAVADAQTSENTDHRAAVNISLDLSEEVQDALQNGVTIMFRCLYAERKSYWFLHRSENLKVHHFSLTRHALSNQYLVKRDDLDALNMFRSLDEATRYIAAQSVLLLEFYHNSATHQSMRLTLNKFKLPAPMRLNAYLSSAWDLDTGWLLW